jgi:iron complex outermembrane recepter protein
MKLKTQPTLFSLLAATLLTASLHADESKSLDPVNVTASEIIERDDLQPDSVTNLYRVESTARAGTEVFTRKEIEAYAPKDLFDLLDKAAGMNLTYQGRRNPYSIEERGGGNLTYIVDGAILSPSVGRILHKIPIAAIEEVQIIRGSTSLSIAPSITVGASNSGSGLNTGFVIIRTKQPKKTEGLISGYVEKAESQPTANGQSLYLGTRLGSEASGTHGYIGGVLSRYDRPSEESRFDGSDAESGMISGGINAGRFSLNLMGYKDSGRQEMQRGVKLDGTLDNSKWYYDPLKTTIFSGDMNMQWNENHTTLFSLFKTTYEQFEHNENFASPAASTRQYEEETRGYSLRHNARFGSTLLMLGGQITDSTGSGANLFNPYNNYDTSVKGFSASIEQKLFEGEVVLDGGYRYDLKHIGVSNVNASKNGAQNDVDMAPAHIIALGGRWQIADALALSGRYYSGDQGTSGDFELNTQTGTPLDAEKQQRIELSVEAAPTRSFRPSLTWFDINIENLKTATNATYTLNGEEYYYYTQSDSHRRGIELTLKGDFNQGTSYSFSWTRMIDNETTSGGTTIDGVGLSSPENLYTALLSHRWDDYRANLSVKKADSWRESTSPMGLLYADLGDYTRIDANIAGDFRYYGNTYTAKLYGRNLGNEHYSTKYVTGLYPDRGRTIGLELSMAF